MSKMQALVIALLLSACCATASAETAIQPLPWTDCRAVADALAKATGIKLDLAEGPAPSLPDGLSGKACRMAGNATGLTMQFDKAQDKIAAALDGWTHDVEQDADGPYSTVKLYARDNQRLVYSLETEPPKGACKDDRPITTCKASRKRWIWNFEVSAFTQ